MDNPFEAARALFVEGNRHLDAGRLHDAEASYVASLARLPGRASTLVNLGAVRIRLGRCADALQALDAALASDPGGLDALAHRGVALLALGRADEALDCFDRVLAALPGDDTAAFHRGRALGALHRHAEALPVFEDLAQRPSANAATWLRLAQTRQALGRAVPALEAYAQALARAPEMAEAWSLRGGLLSDLGRTAEAAQSFRRALELGADPVLNGWFLAALTGSETPPAPPRAYVAGLFDEYADNFDAHLVHRLGYRAPEAMADLLRRHSRGAYGAALDLGCGTGLCAPRLRPLLRSGGRLDGVDLSGRMIAKARARGLYDSLVQADIGEHLQSATARWDLVAAADVFNYVGGLDAVFAGVQRVLEPSGDFVFSIEPGGDGERGFALSPDLRYLHSERYLDDLALRHGFTVVARTREKMREDQGRPVDALFVLLRRA
jgi:predicted TPR repeat methyltransferase